MSFYGNDVLSAAQFKRASIENLFARADELRTQLNDSAPTRTLADKRVATAFFEPSTRTLPGFADAIHQLGARLAPFDTQAKNFPEALNALARDVDALILRHPETGAAQHAADTVSIPIINAGDGAGEHPTQALIDLYAIRAEKRTLDHLRVALVGDLKNSGAAHSLARALSLFQVDLSFVAPAALAMPPDITDYLRENEFSVEETNDLPKTLQKMDVVYMTGMQRERFADLRQYEKFKNFFVLTRELITNAQPNLVVLHPSPHGDEIAPDVDALPNAAYFRQAENALFVRMALLEAVLVP
ncbi:MAG: aspartate carbamoyltransferase [Chloroflexi bacterium]|nr:aspartate carbamoyltransferase [Chloroflexota bacterium]